MCLRQPIPAARQVGTHFDCQPWIPVGDEHLSLISIDINQYNNSRNIDPEGPLRDFDPSRPALLLCRCTLARNIAAPTH